VDVPTDTARGDPTFASSIAKYALIAALADVEALHPDARIG